MGLIQFKSLLSEIDRGHIPCQYETLYLPSQLCGKPLFEGSTGNFAGFPHSHDTSGTCERCESKLTIDLISPSVSDFGMGI